MQLYSISYTYIQLMGRYVKSKKGTLCTSSIYTKYKQTIFAENGN
jgi:hypothetical protein